MKFYHPTVFFLTFFSFSLFGQKVAVEGIVADSAGVGLPAATVVLLQKQDSVMTAFGISDTDGRFSLKRIAPGDYLLQVSYVGYETHYRPLSLAAEPAKTDAGTITLATASADLAAVEVTAEHVPMRFSRDTLEYNADAFKTQPGAVVEDLLKKLPGVEIGRDGSIKAQGETVQNVLVDGKEFFGNDPTIATKNLPADAVKKVQVFDKKSDKAEFTGIEDGRDEKTINLSLKDGKKQGYFGNATAGAGALQNADGSYDPDRYEGKFNVNRFSKNTQFSVLGMANNTNQQGFSFNDYLQFMGGMSNLMSGGGGKMQISLDPGSSGIPMGAGPASGLNATWAGGLNFNHDFSKKTELNASYFYNRIENDIERTVTRENLLGDAGFASGEDEDRLSRNQNHRFNLRLQHEIDSFQNLILRSRLGFNDAFLDSDGTSFTRNTAGFLENEGLRNYHADGENLSLNTNLTYRRRFRNLGRSFVADLTFGKQDNERAASLYSLNRFFQNGNPTFAEAVDQRQGYADDAADYGLTLSYTEPLGKKRYLEFEASRRNYSNETAKDFFDRQPGGEEVFNELLSTHFNRGYRYDRGGLNFLMNRKKYNLTLGAALQQSKLKGELAGGDVPISRSFTRVLPSLFFDYEFGTSRNFNFSYTTSLREPSLEQLLPVVDNSDPLNTFTGNPNLQPEYAHDLGLRYMLFDAFSFTSFFANVNATYTKDRITNASSIDSLFRRNTRPVNVDNDLALRSYLSFGTPLRFIQSNIHLDLNNTWNRGILFVNEMENTATRQRHSIDLSLDNRKKDFVDVAIGVRFSHNKTTYSENSSLNQTYLDRLFYADLTLTPTEKWSIGSSFDYTIYSEENFGGKRSVPIWRASVSRYFLKNNRGQLKLAAFDLLNKNIGINRNSQLNYVEEERIRSLGRYVMLSFSYSISGFGKKSGGIEIKMDERRR